MGRFLFSTKRWTAVGLVAGFVLAASPASAELVFFGEGRNLSIKGHREEGDSVVLLLRAGGEIVCDRSVIARIEPDEVPYPEPKADVPVVVTAASPAPYADLVDEVAARHGVNPRLVNAMIRVESGYRADARSRKGAMGLMQLMPETARQYAVQNPYEPRANIEAGIKHLRSLLERFTLPLALAAYNAGEAAVQRFGGVPPYPETRDYVQQVLRLSGL
jgi:hypothetical protein